MTIATLADRALKLAKEQHFDVALLVELKLAEGESDGIELMQNLHHLIPEMSIIILIAYGTIESVVEAMKCGAYSYLKNPLTIMTFFYR